MSSLPLLLRVQAPKVFGAALTTLGTGRTAPAGRARRRNIHAAVTVGNDLTNTFIPGNRHGETWLMITQISSVL